jgi:hypothetical protein
MQKMNKEFVPHEQALKLKELGFDEPCFGLYHKDGFLSLTISISHEQYYGQECLAPTYQQAFRFFRDKNNLEYQISKSANGNYYATIHKNTQEYLDTIASLRYACFDEVVDCYSYEEAESECLKKLIEIVKNNNL